MRALSDLVVVDDLVKWLEREIPLSSSNIPAILLRG